MRCSLKIPTIARDSPLSRAQFREVEEKIQRHNPKIELIPCYIKTRGDLDRAQSLRTLAKSDFFTREIDEKVLSREYRLAVHSAKDLSDPLRENLVVAALTTSIDPGDVLVLREGESFATLAPLSLIASSSDRREATVRALRGDLLFTDLRGTIEERLALLFERRVDGVVVAEAAILRLGLTHLNRLRLPGSTAQHQGRLALVVHAEDSELLHLLEGLI